MLLLPIHRLVLQSRKINMWMSSTCAKRFLLNHTGSLNLSAAERIPCNDPFLASGIYSLFYTRFRPSFSNRWMWEKQCVPVWWLPLVMQLGVLRWFQICSLPANSVNKGDAGQNSWSWNTWWAHCAGTFFDFAAMCVVPSVALRLGRSLGFP